MQRLTPRVDAAVGAPRGHGADAAELLAEVGLWFGWMENPRGRSHD